MKRYQHGMAALQNTLHQYLLAKGKPVEMSRLQYIAKRIGFTANDARHQLHKLAQAGKVEYVSDPTNVSVVATGGDK